MASIRDILPIIDKYTPVTSLPTDLSSYTTIITLMVIAIFASLISLILFTVSMII